MRRQGARARRCGVAAPVRLHALLPPPHRHRSTNPRDIRRRVGAMGQRGATQGHGGRWCASGRWYRRHDPQRVLGGRPFGRAPMVLPTRTGVARAPHCGPRRWCAAVRSGCATPARIVRVPGPVGAWDGSWQSIVSGPRRCFTCNTLLAPRRSALLARLPRRGVPQPGGRPVAGARWARAARQIPSGWPAVRDGLPWRRSGGDGPRAGHVPGRLTERTRPGRVTTSPADSPRLQASGPPSQHSGHLPGYARVVRRWNSNDDGKGDQPLPHGLRRAREQ